MKTINNFISEKLLINSKTKIKKQTKINNDEYHAIHETCILLDNDEKLYNEIIKVANKINKLNPITFEEVSLSPDISSLANKALSMTKMEIKSDEGKDLLNKYVAAVVLNYYVENEMGNLKKEEQDKVDEYHYSKITWK